MRANNAGALVKADIAVAGWCLSGDRVQDRLQPIYGLASILHHRNDMQSLARSHGAPRQIGVVVGDNDRSEAARCCTADQSDSRDGHGQVKSICL